MPGKLTGPDWASLSPVPGTSWCDPGPSFHLAVIGSGSFAGHLPDTDTSALWTARFPLLHVYPECQQGPLLP